MTATHLPEEARPTGNAYGPGAVRRADIRNVAIIAHVDHGKTTLVDCLLRQCGNFRAGTLEGERILDSNDLERERGITILAKNIAFQYEGVKINLIDTPGHADFGGEVERVLRMADGALVLIDAAEGPMPQTRFVLGKALAFGLKPIVVVNKIDRPDARCQEVLNEVLDLFIDLGAEDAIDDFTQIFASAKEGFATHDPAIRGESVKPLLDLILEKIPGPVIDADGPLQMLVTNLDWSSYVGRIAVGRIYAGTVKKGQPVVLMQKDDKQMNARATQVHVFDKLGRVEVEQAEAGDICALVGLEEVEIGDTVASLEKPLALPRVEVDAPTLEMVFSVNTSPLSGRDGKFLTNRHLRDRLDRELEKNVALRIRQEHNSDAFIVSGRGLLHLSVLIETMRREGYELSVGKPHVIMREHEGVIEEPFETLNVEVPTDRVGPVMELVGARRGQLKHMHDRGDFTHVTFSIPARGLIGLRTRLLNATAGEAIMHHRFDRYAAKEEDLPGRANGVLVSMTAGKAVAYSLDSLQERSDLFVKPGDEVYEGMIVGENARSEDMNVNPTREKKLTNMRAAGKDDNVLLKPPRDMSLEVALEYIEEDELVEVTPSTIRLRKVILSEADRRRTNRQK